MPWAGGQVMLAVRNPRRRDLGGIIDWRVAELKRLGVEVRYDILAELEDVLALEPDVVIVATGGLPQLPEMEAGAEHVVTVWDILGGEVRPGDSVLLYDDDGTHSAMSAAEVIARSGAELEIVTPERTLGVEVGGMNHVPYARAFNETDTKVTLNQRVIAVHADGGRLRVEVGSDHSGHTTTRTVDQVVADHGTRPNADLYFDLKAGSSNLGEVDYDALINGRPQEIVNNSDGTYRLFRIGDAVTSRDIHAAIYDALRLMKDV
jgi:pyruvate/2-oxoglutarate dehydrogenase complex dihydrolipoamide dehydrogenase (E3) component